MHSPICHFFSATNSSLFKTASEKEQDLKTIADDKKIIISTASEPGFNIRARKNESDNSHEIVPTVASLEYIWAFSNFFWVFTQEYSKSQKNNDEHSDLIGKNRFKKSDELPKWARKNLQTTGCESWPKKCPKPGAYLQGSEDSQVASEIFLCTTVWTLHHEVSHVISQYLLVTTALFTQEEREADSYATKWILGNLYESAPELKKRAPGIVTAVLCIQSLEVENYFCLQNTYPAACERTYSNISCYPVGNEELIETLCTAMLQYFFHGKNINVNLDGESFSSILGDLPCDISCFTSN